MTANRPAGESEQLTAPAGDIHDDSQVAQVDARPFPDEVVPDRRQFRYWTTNWSFRDIDIGTLARRLARIGIAAPVDLDGQVSVELTVSIPINALRDATAYRLSGTLTSPRLRIESTELRLRTDVNYAGGIASLNNLQGAFFGDTGAGARPEFGEFQGAASLRLAGEGERLARVDLAAEQLQMSVLTNSLAQDSDFRINARGVATGALRWLAPVDSVTNAATWDAQGQLSLVNLSIDDRPPLDLETGPLRIADGKISVPNLRVHVGDVPEAGLTVAFEADFRDMQSWSAHVVSQRLPVESVAAVLAFGVVPETHGELTLDLVGQGTLAPLDWQIEGQVQSPALSIYGVRLGELNHALATDAGMFDLAANDEDDPPRTHVRAVRADYTITPEAIDLGGFRAEIFDGLIEGDLRWARDATRDHRANLTWSQLALRWDLGAVMTGASGELLLGTQGRLAWQAPADSIELPAEHSMRAKVQIDELALAGQPIGNASIQVRAVEGELALRGEGTLLGGTFQVDSATPIPADADWSAWLGGERMPLVPNRMAVEPGDPWEGPHVDTQDETLDEPLGTVQGENAVGSMDSVFPTTGQFLIQGVSLLRTGAFLGRWLGNGGTGRGWSGRGDAEVQFDLGSPNSGGWLVTRCRIGLFDFAIERSLISRSLVIDLRSWDSELLIDRVQGTYAGGTVGMSGLWSLEQGPRQLDVSFFRVDAGRALLPLTTDASQWFRGEISGQGRLTGQRDYRIAGSLEGRRAVLFGLPLGTVRSGVTGAINQGAWELRFPNVGSTVARGRITGLATVSSSSSGRSFDLRSRWTVLSDDQLPITTGRSGLRGHANHGRRARLLASQKNVRPLQRTAVPVS